VKTSAAPRSSKRAFTLVEMVAAIAVLTLLLAIILSIVNAASKVADNAFRSGDSSEEATQILDRISADVAGMIIRPDVDQYYVNQAGNDEMFFYSQTPGYFGTSTAPVTSTEQSPVSLIGYRISTTANANLPPMLERLVQGVTWDGQTGTLPLPFLTFAAPTSVSLAPAAATGGTIPLAWSAASPDPITDPDTNPDTSASYWHTVGPQVFRLEICYQLRDGSFTLKPPTPSAPPALSTSTTSPVPPVPGSINDTTGIVVAIAVLDTKSRQIVPPASWAGLITALKDPTQTDLGPSPYTVGSTPPVPILMNTTWNNALQASGFAQSVGIPQMAAAQITVYQRYYPLTAPIAK